MNNLMNAELPKASVPNPSSLPIEGQPNLPTPPIDQHFDKPREVTSAPKKRDFPEGLFKRCPDCSEMISIQQLHENLKVCPGCQYHFVPIAKDRIAWLFDEGTFDETDDNLVPVDAIKFHDLKPYTERLKTYQKETGIKDAVMTGFGEISGCKAGIAVMDFAFIGASMGSVVGEKITRIIEKSTKKKVPVIIVCASGGARMQEGFLSLMQMAKTSAALARHAQAKLACITILTHPTMGGVTASFATLGDIIVAEPKSMIGFAGARVIRETTREELPQGFQTSEFLLERGLVDMIVHRKNLKNTLTQILEFVG
jgi:acetyl-CoA carboxylase carboxyl transferase subunit beta